MFFNMRKLSIITTLLVLGGCYGETDDATNISSDGATLWGTGTCETGDCDVYFEYWQRSGGAQWAAVTPLLQPRGMDKDTTDSVWATISGLEPDTDYEFRFCGKELSDSEFLCDPDWKSFRTLPPPEISVFSANLSGRNTVTLTWETSGGLVGEPIHIYGEFHEPVSGVYYRNVGYRTDQTNLTGLSFRVKPGLHRYTLELPTVTGMLTRVVDVDVEGPTSPIITSPVNPLYPLGLASQTVTWPALASDEFMRIKPPGQPTINVHSQNSHTFTAQYLDQNMGEGEHKVAYFICVDMSGAVPAMSSDFCSLQSVNPIVIGSARFQGPERYFADTTGSVTLNWDSVGDSSILFAPDELGGRVDTTLTSHTFSDLEVGIHNVFLDSCISSPANCVNTADVIATVSGTVLSIEDQNSLFNQFGLQGAPQGHQMALIEETGTSTQVPVYAPATGILTEAQPFFLPGQTVSAGDILMTQRKKPRPFAQIVVRDQNFDRVPWTQDFAPFFPVIHNIPFTSHVRLGSVLALRVAEDGSVWSAGEFADSSITQITGFDAEEVITPLAAPLLNIPDGPTPTRLRPVKPFNQPNLNNASVTKQETIIEQGRYLWFLNGGSTQGIPGVSENWNRIVRFDRAETDISDTLYDDRFCVIHVPTSNALVLGLDWDESRERIWYVESRLNVTGPPVLGWFKPAEMACENLLDYSDPAAIAAASTQYCANPGDPGCITTISLADSDGSGRELNFAAHAKVDDDVVWVAGYGNSRIARVTISTGQVDILDTDPPSVVPGSEDSFYGSGPWQFFVDDTDVYFSEFFDGDIVKLNKATLNADLASGTNACKDTGGADNPCMQEIHATENIKEIDLHNDRLYFAGLKEFGYINFSSWTPGFLYSGIEQRRDPERARIGRLISSDMSVSKDGMVVINDYLGRSIMRFYPK